MKNNDKTMSRWFVLVLLLCPIAASVSAIAVIPPLFIEIIEQIPLTKAQMGLTMGVISVVALVFAPLGGILSDKFGCRWIIGIGIGVGASGTMLLARAENVGDLISCMFLVGVGLNTITPGSIKILAQWFTSKELGLVNGIAVAVSTLTVAVGTATAVDFLSPFFGGWRSLISIAGLVFLVTGIIWVLFYRDPKMVEDEEKRGILEDLKSIIKIRDFQLLTALFLFDMMAFMPLPTFLPISLQERGVPHAEALVGGIFFMTVVFSPIGGIVSDKLGKRKPLLLLAIFASGALSLTYASFTGYPLIISTILTGAFWGIGTPLLWTLVVEIEGIGPELAATAVGFMFMTESIGGFLGPLLIGKMIDASGSYMTGFACIAAIFTIAAIFGVFVKETSKEREVAT